MSINYDIRRPTYAEMARQYHDAAGAERQKRFVRDTEALRASLTDMPLGPSPLVPRPTAAQAGASVTDQGVEWARISADGTVSKLDLDAARGIVARGSVKFSRQLMISDVVATLVLEAYAQGKRDATPARPMRVRDM